jgi:hypothetical protein
LSSGIVPLPVEEGLIKGSIIGIAALLLWVLPAFGVNVPPWVVAAVLACFAV